MKGKAKVDFILLGAMKCATSTMASILAAHPSISFPMDCEPNYFLHPESRRNRREKEAYLNLFNSKEELWGERSTEYSKDLKRSTQIASNIFDYNEEMRFIYMVRHPIERLVSHYVHLYQKGSISLSLNEAIDRHSKLLETGMYATQIEPYIKKFGRENILFINFHNFIKDKKFALHMIAKFLGVTPSGFYNFEELHLNRSIGQNITPHQYDHIVRSRLGKWIRKKINPVLGRKFLIYLAGHEQRIFQKKPIPNRDALERLFSLYKPELDTLEALTEWDLTTWRNINTYLDGQA